ncbi:MAG: Fe-S cluster assembly protein SufD [Nocardioidaceae bacterium]
MTVIESPAVAGAVETTDRIASHLHAVASFDLDDHPMPTGREEVWRFTPLKRLRGALDDATAHDETAVTYEVTAGDDVLLGTLAPAESPRGTALVPGDRAAAVASKNTEKSLHVKVPADAVVAEPVHIVVQGEAGRHSFAHHVLEVGTHANVTFVLEHRGSGVHAHNLEVIVGDGANVSVISIQDWDDDAVHVGQQEARVGRAATYRHVSISFGGDLVRLNNNVHYQGPGGEAELLGLYFADAGQHLEHRLFVDHNEPRTRSNVDYKGALQGEGAHAVWVGDVLIRQVAEGIDTYESNRNLVLTDGCRADSVPNLEIETGEIEGAGHASTTGRFDDAQLFYLQSRGIHEDDARRLVVHGFFADIIRKIGVPQIEEKLLATVEAELEKNVMQGAS